MKVTSAMALTLFSFAVLAQQNEKTYLPDENHLPGYRSPAAQKQAQEARDLKPKEIKEPKRTHPTKGEDHEKVR